MGLSGGHEGLEGQGGLFVAAADAQLVAGEGVSQALSQEVGYVCAGGHDAGDHIPGKSGNNIRLWQTLNETKTHPLKAQHCKTTLRRGPLQHPPKDGLVIVVGPRHLLITALDDLPSQKRPKASLPSVFHSNPYRHLLHLLNKWRSHPHQTHLPNPPEEFCGWRNGDRPKELLAGGEGGVLYG